MSSRYGTAEGETEDLLKKEVLCLLLHVFIHLCVWCHDSLHLMIKFQALVSAIIYGCITMWPCVSPQHLWLVKFLCCIFQPHTLSHLHLFKEGVMISCARNVHTNEALALTLPSFFLNQTNYQFVYTIIASDCW